MLKYSQKIYKYFARISHSKIDSSTSDYGFCNLSKPLKEYSTFVEEVIVNNKSMSMKDAVNKSVEDCIRNDVLKEFLTNHRKEVVDMCLTEFDETKWGELMKEEGRQEGFKEGASNTVLDFVRKGKITLVDASEALVLDIEATEKLLAENGISVPSMV